MYEKKPRPNPPPHPQAPKSNTYTPICQQNVLYSIPILGYKTNKKYNSKMKRFEQKQKLCFTSPCWLHRYHKRAYSIVHLFVSYRHMLSNQYKYFRSTYKHQRFVTSFKTPEQNPDYLTYWGRVTHICVSKLAIIGSENDLSHDLCIRHPCVSICLWVMKHFFVLSHFWSIERIGKPAQHSQVQSGRLYVSSLHALCVSITVKGRKK